MSSPSANGPSSTSPSTTDAGEVISPTRAFEVTVTRRCPLSPHLIRLTLTGPDLHLLGAAGFDQRIKLVVPLGDGTVDAMGLMDQPETPHSVWYPRWRDLPRTERHPIRTYTVRYHRPRLRELDIDFVLHHHPGPASAWAEDARPGHQALIIGPNARTGQPFGVVWQPGLARRVLLAGDETALPAISATLEQLGPDIEGHALIEVPHLDDQLTVITAASITTTWLPRHRTPHGRLLTTAVHDWASTHTARPSTPIRLTSLEPTPSVWDVPALTTSAQPGDLQPGPMTAHGAATDPPSAQPTSDSDDLYLWLAGESATITGLRRHLLTHTTLHRHQIAFMGYWRHGQPQA